MRINYNTILDVLENEAIEQTSRRLEKQGFQAIKGYRFENYEIDLFAEKGEEKRLYEFKIAKERSRSSSKEKEHYLFLQSLAKQLRARLVYVFVKPPKEGVSVSIDGFEELLYDDICKTGKMPLEQKQLICTDILEVSDVQFTMISLHKDEVFVSGHCIVNIEENRISSTVSTRNPNCVEFFNEDVAVYYEIRMDTSLNIIESKYRLDID